MKKINSLFFLIAIALSFSVVVSSCSKDDDDDNGSTPTPSGQPYVNMNDNTTTDVQLTIPRIEVDPARASNVKLYLSVTDQNGNPLQEFNQFNFVIKQVCAESTDSVVVASISFGTLNQQGGDIASGITMDYSGSMTSYDITNMENAVRFFIRNKQPMDQMEVIKFATDVEKMVDFTTDTTNLINAVNTSVDIGIYTSFFDAVYMGLEDAHNFSMINSNYLPAVLGFTDGYNNDSGHTLSDVVAASNNWQIPVYTLGFGDADVTTLENLANQTGGRYFYSPDSGELQEIYNLISGQLKNLYVASWVFALTNCYEGVISVEVSYTCSNGTFTSQAIKYFEPLK